MSDANLLDAISQLHAETTQPSAPPSAPQRYSLATIFRIVTAVSLICGLAVIAPGIGIPVAIFLPPVLVRMGIVFRHEPHHKATFGSQVAIFGQSIGAVFLVSIASSVMLFASCSASLAVGGFFEYINGIRAPISEDFNLICLLGFSWALTTPIAYLLMLVLLRLKDRRIPIMEHALLCIVSMTSVAVSLVCVYLLVRSL